MKNKKTFETIPQIESLLIRICELTGFNVEAVKSKYRKTELVTIRYIFFYFSKQIFLESYPIVIIARHVNRDHSTLIHGIEDFKTKIEVGDSIVMNYYNIVLKGLKDYKLTNIEANAIISKIERINLETFDSNHILKLSFRLQKIRKFSELILSEREKHF